jgi:beta-mannosidase
VEDVTWWYRTRFSAAPPKDARATLILRGVDTVATIWLNGPALGRHDSQFRPATFDVSEILGEDNDLLIRFDPPLAGLAPPASVVQRNTRRGSGRWSVGLVRVWPKRHESRAATVSR